MALWDDMSLERRAQHGAAVATGCRHRRWTDEDYGWALRLAADKNGRVTTASYNALYERRKGTKRPVPTTRAMWLRYGSWKEAVGAHGLTPGRTNRSYTRRSDADLAAAIGAVITALGAMPTVTSYDVWRAGHPELGLPCCALLRQRFKTWPLALQAGLDANARVSAVSAITEPAATAATAETPVTIMPGGPR